MRHRVAGKQLSRNTAHRKAMRRNMVIALFQHGAIRTTETKAKELRPYAEKIITAARNAIASGNVLHARRLISAELGNRRGIRGEMYNVVDGDDEQLQDKSILQKLFDEIAPRYANRPGGYTRIIRLADRRIGDAGKQVVLQLVEETSAESSAAGRPQRRRTEPGSAAAAPSASPDVQGQASQEQAE